MTNGKLSTPFVLRWIELNPKHAATAPKAGKLLESRAFAGIGWVRVESRTHTCWFPAATLFNRTDWTIRNQFGEPVEFKRKRKPTRAGTLLVTNHGGLRIVLGESIAPGEYDLFTRERRS